MNDDTKNMLVKISSDFSSVVLVNKTENYILEFEESENEGEVGEYH